MFVCYIVKEDGSIVFDALFTCEFDAAEYTGRYNAPFLKKGYPYKAPFQYIYWPLERKV